MRFNSITAAACLVVATSAFNTSPEAIFGYSNIEARADNNTVYVPTQTLCGMGDSCAQACGASFDMCPSGDESIHCFDKERQKCCPGGKGVSCDAGFFCADNAKGEQICCPEGKPLDQCSGAVTSLAPFTPTSAAPTSTAAAVTKNVTIATTGAIVKSTALPSGTAKATGVIPSKSGSGGSDSGAAPTGESSASPVPVGAASAVAPAGMAVLAFAGLAALL
ncbi:hypothetical protein MCOR25_006999 [Pyricularia grisea]|uniref:Uncharacterized protein n=1 Tax=Pyricularia grisea TaxID=148305 RepID=A0A6P8B855_PYRGI|nr:uncharacterized protein PgNI_04073 [Pyricularia grisea]KAI6359673.1 hypothetical protein MCOR25_006999 [Pyricularia grisea]TLD12054.1 hypothetical protein PgNI_04073 [Pyricularia grisea]